MRKVVFLQKSNIYSGAENIVIKIMKLLSQKDYSCVYVSPDGEIREFVEEIGLTFYPIVDSSIVSVRKAICQIQPDIIHTTDYGMSTYASLLNLGIPIVAHLHNNAPWLKNPLYPKTILFAKALKNINQVISVSPSIEKEFVYRNLLKKKNHVIYNVVDIERVRKLATECKSNEKFDIAFLGRLTSPKNPLLFCKIVMKYKEINEHVKAVMIGEGELRNEVEQFINKNNLKDNILLMGFQKNPYKIINNSKILLMPSKYEGFGLVAVESLALGIPVVCSGVGGLKDIITEKCGAICSETFEYSKEIQKLLNDEQYYKKKSQNAKINAQRFGNLKLYIERILEVYDKCL